MRYALGSVEEAAAYVAHPVLGARLAQATDLMLAHAGTPAEPILGGIDAVKFRSSMTLFRAAAPGDPRFDAPSPPSSAASRTRARWS